MRFDQLRKLLREWPPSPFPELSELGGESQFSDESRLLECLRQMPPGGAAGSGVGKGDLAALFRQVLCRLELQSPGAGPLSLEVPFESGWPDQATWKAFSIDAVPCKNEGRPFFKIKAQKWTANWLDESDEATKASISKKPRSIPPEEPIRADPSVRDLLGYEDFKSKGQAEAMRAAALLPAGNTLVVGLPTGAGKSIIFQYLGLDAEKSQSGKTVVIVVPTIALALDQERRMNELLARQTRAADQHIAYHSGLPDDAKKEFRSRLRQGRQSIVITSPESVLGGLQSALHDVAAKGRLAWLCIDEAHHVGQWGENFRPEFQQIAAAVAAWRGAAGAPEKEVRSLLLTATLSQSALDTIRTLFTPVEENGSRSERAFHVLVSPELRPEPDFWMAQFGSKEERESAVVDAVRHLPRPLIVYTTLREDAARIHRRLQDEEGFRRTARARGGEVDQGLLRNWSEGQIEIVVATSAFGLGMDNSDVRSVIHACIPETVDRYYQEVGRAGRDGNASLSFWLTTEQDWEDTKKVGGDQSLKLDTAFDRWKSMRDREETSSDFRYREFLMRLDTVLDRLEGDNDANRKWNLRTLLMMANAGAIALRTPQPPPRLEVREGESPEELKSRQDEAWNRWRNSLMVQKLAPNEELDHEEGFNKIVGPVREKRKKRWSTSLKELSALLGREKAFHEVFAEVYQFELEPGGSQVRFLRGDLTGRCPLSRANGRLPGVHIPLDRVYFSKNLYEKIRFSDLARLSGDGSSPVFIPYPLSSGVRARGFGSRRRRQEHWTPVFRLLEELAKRGCIEFGLEPTWSEQHEKEILKCARTSSARYIVEKAATESGEFDSLSAARPRLPRVTVLLPGEELEKNFDLVQGLDRPAHIILFPSDLKDLERDNVCWADTHTSLPIETALARLG